MEDSRLKQFLEKIFTNSPIAFSLQKLLLDEQGHPADYEFIYVNKAFEIAMGIEGKDVAGKQFSSVFQPESQNDTVDNWVLIPADAVLKHAPVRKNLFFKVVGKWFHLDAFEIEDSVFALFANDITEEIEKNISSQYTMQLNLSIKEKHLELLKSGGSSVNDFLNKTLIYAIEFTQSRLGYIFLYDEEKEEFVLHSWSEFALDECRIMKRERLYKLPNVGLWGEAIRLKQPVIVNDYSADHPKKKGYPEGHVHINKFASIPVFSRGKIVATVGVANKATDYNDEDILNLTLLMNTIWSEVERIKDEEILSGERELLKTTLLSINEGIIITDHEGRILLMNFAAERYTGWKKEEAYGQNFDDVFKMIDGVSGIEKPGPIHQVLETNRDYFTSDNTILLSRDGLKAFISGSAVRVQPGSENAAGVVISFKDITEEHEAEEMLKSLVSRDRLTGLYNRHYFDNLIGTEMERADAYHEPLSMAMFDIDHFKNVNDTYGHPAGDVVLKELAGIVSANIRGSDVLIRYGGEEFILLMPKTDINGAYIAAEKIRSLLEKNSNPIVGTYTASFGIAERMLSEPFESWYERTDEALYKAKNDGRNRVATASEQVVKPIATVHFEWKEEWNSGNETIDRQHRELLDFANVLIFMSLSGTDLAKMLKQLEMLMSHIMTHFTDEENLITEAGYPEIDAHREIHHAIYEKSAQLIDSCTNNTINATTLFSFIVDDVVVGHILKEDTKFFPYTKAKALQDQGKLKRNNPV